MRSFKSMLMWPPCKGITKNGKPCRAVETWSNGYCKHHGGEGVSPEEVRRQLFEQRRSREIEKAHRTLARYRRRHNLTVPVSKDIR